MNAATVAILLDYYFLYVLALFALRSWDEGSADDNLDRVTRLLGELPQAGLVLDVRGNSGGGFDGDVRAEGAAPATAKVATVRPTPDAVPRLSARGLGAARNLTDVSFDLHAGEEQQADEIAQQMIAGHLVGVLEVLADEDAVIVQRRIRAQPEGIVERGAWAHEVEADRPAHRTKPHVHRAGPVDPPADGIGLQEIIELTGHLDREPIVVRQPVRLTKRGPVLAA